MPVHTHHEAATKTIQVVSFTIGKEEYGIHIEDVQEIVRMPEIMKLPRTESFIRGVINLRGIIIPVIDMRERFGISASESGYSAMTRVIVVKVKEKFVGVIVDTVSQVLEIAAEDITEAPEVLKGISREFIEGIGKLNENLIIILRIQNILTDKEFEKIRDV
jgi:purine-binding chemotaxis protein CheW